MATTAHPTRDDFAKLLNETLGGEDQGFEGRVVTGTVTAIAPPNEPFDIRRLPSFDPGRRPAVKPPAAPPPSRRRQASPRRREPY